MRNVVLASSLLMVLVGACAATARQVPVKANDKDLLLFAGQWEGQYDSVETGRYGTIQLDLEVGRHTGRGAVVMHTREDAAKAHPLKIREIVIYDRTITGVLAPYQDPGTGHKVTTHFVGTIEGDEIVGTFTTRLVDRDMEQTGNWSAVRKRRY